MPESASASGAIAHRRSKVVVEGATVATALALAAWAWVADPFWVELHGNPLRCVTSPHELSIGNFFRAIALFTSVFLLVGVRRWLGHWAGRSGITLAGAARITLALILALGTSEVLLRKPWKGPPPPIPCPICPPTIPSPRCFWQLTPSTQHVWVGPHDIITYFTDADGNRAASTAAHVDHDRPTLILGGESIALGIGVAYEDTIAGILEKDLGIQVVDTGVFGYGMDQAYLREEEVIAAYRHPVALVTVFVPEQVERAELDARIALVADDPGGITMRPPLAPWIQHLELRRLWRGLYHGDAEIENLRAVARATVALAKRRGAYPLFVTTNFLEPCLDVRGRPPALFRTLFDDQQIARIHVDLPTNQHVDGDPHPGPISQRALAEAIEKKLRVDHVF